ncbi:hypothetical protein Q5425_05055 [Amycolatopsis sp. A133]|uniref:RICIN domain-containing protein n=1 Tax=Amycolatopsis sp. A133 TaxID=3064472 RepID=UPI0027FD8E89|nr:hypothetical protein [Amycolatopsis sp. A133]MDQ7803086.1 hypothetical protein [Amycolatopsis sp. A133]
MTSHSRAGCTLTNDHSGLDLGVEGTAVVQQTTATQWVITRQPSGYATPANAGRVLSVAGESTMDGARPEVPAPGSAAQEWTAARERRPVRGDRPA